MNPCPYHDTPTSGCQHCGLDDFEEPPKRSFLSRRFCVSMDQVIPGEVCGLGEDRDAIVVGIMEGTNQVVCRIQNTYECFILTGVDYR